LGPADCIDETAEQQDDNVTEMHAETRQQQLEEEDAGSSTIPTCLSFNSVHSTAAASLATEPEHICIKGDPDSAAGLSSTTAGAVDKQQPHEALTVQEAAARSCSIPATAEAAAENSFEILQQQVAEIQQEMTGHQRTGHAGSNRQPQLPDGINVLAAGTAAGCSSSILCRPPTTGT